MPSLIQRVETSTSPTADDVIHLDSAIRWLRARGVDDQVTIREALQGAVNEAEKRTQRTLRKSVTRTVYYTGWAYCIPCPYPPLQSITSVKYYDSSNVLQTTSASDYTVSASTNGQGQILFDSDYSFPTLYTDRIDRVQVIMVTGYGTDDVIPPATKTAIRLLTQASYDGDQAKRMEAYTILAPHVFRGP